MKTVTKLEDLLEFLRLHDGPDTKIEEGLSDLFDSPTNYSRSIARFSDGAVLLIATSYESDYSELTPGEGFRVWCDIYEPGEYRL